MDSAVGKSHVDVLIIGAGPTGLMTALWMAELGISTRIVDLRGTRALNGRTDGFHVRTVEIWDSFGIANILQQQGVRFGEWSLWVPGDNGSLQRARRESAVGLDVSRLHSCTMHQGHTEAVLTDAIKKRSGAVVERGVAPVGLEVDETLVDDPNAFPIKVELRHVRKEELTTWHTNAHSVQDDGSVKAEKGNIETPFLSTDDSDTIPTISGEENTTETVHAKYVLGSEGAHSWVRRQLAFNMVGASTNSVWGVIDIVAITDFPDFRKNCTVLSKAGTILSVPREKGMTRLYVQLPDSDSQFDTMAGSDTSTIAKQIIASARKIIAPYSLEYRYCDWWTVYRVGQRVCDQFSYKNRIFLGGDAVHTHTPKGGQGMNVSMQDAFNLGWKLGGVIKGQLDRSILGTYEAERRPIAQDLIDLDTDMARVLSGKTMADEAEVRQVYARLRNYGSGANLSYGRNSLIAASDMPCQPVSAKQHLASNLKLGMRFPSHQVLNQSNAISTETQSLLKSDGSWRLLVFAGDITNERQLERVNTLGEKLSGLQDKFLSIRPDRPFLEVLLFFCARMDQIELNDFHRTFFPFDETKGYDYNKIFADPPASRVSSRAESAHVGYGISIGKGCMVVARPDQCISWIGELEDTEVLERYFDGFMVRKAVV
ncbi:MAG: hypothetical protein M1819_005888 [Sarea resinae]|nr:MAG: hypothetical protein M1819_005888 [Sarea resinae]